MGRPKELSNNIKNRVYCEWILSGAKQKDLAKKFNISTNSIHLILEKKLVSNQHKRKVKEIRRMNGDSNNEYYTKTPSKDVDLVPSFEGVDIYKTIGAWGKYEQQQYKLLKSIKGEC